MLSSSSTCHREKIEGSYHGKIGIWDTRFAPSETIKAASVESSGRGDQEYTCMRFKCFKNVGVYLLACLSLSGALMAGKRPMMRQ